MCTQSESVAKLAIALIQVQKVIEGASRDSNNPFFNSNYADLSSVWKVCRKPLAENGLCIIQTNKPTDGTTVIVVTTLIHTTGEWIKGELTMRPVKVDPQGIGSAMTYARRYGLAAIVGVIQEDDDANSAIQSSVNRGTQNVRSVPRASKGRGL